MPRQLMFFALLREVNVISNESVNLLSKLVTDFKDIEGYYKKAKELELKGDRKTHEIIDGLNRTFITPIDREDIYLLAHELDDVIDVIEDIVRAMYLYQVKSPLPALTSYVPLIKNCSKCLGELLTCLESLKHTEHVTKLKQTIRDNKHKGDSIHNQAITNLLKDSGKDAIKVIKQKDILELLHGLMNKYKKLADLIEGIIVKSS